MSKKRFKPYSVPTTDGDGFVIGIQKEDGTVMSITDASEMLNEQQEEIAYWKHKVSSLLWILGQFDEQKVKKLLEELDE